MTSSADAARYAETIMRLNAAAAAWSKAHPFAELRFRTEAFVREMIARSGHEHRDWTKVAIAANLCDCIDGWAANEDTRQFLSAVDEATGRQATFMQMRALVELQIDSALKKRQGKLPPGNWACIACGEVIDGFSCISDDADVTPTPGSYTVCAECGKIQRITAAIDAFEEAPVSDFNQLPKSLRKRLLAARDMVHKRIADEKARS